MLFKRKNKIFCIGRNKTGTTSLKRAFSDLGFSIGNQRVAEKFLEDWARRDFKRIIHYCKSATAFQDIPFSLPYTYQALDSAFPRCKFILTVRESAEEWYKSITKAHTKLIGKGRLPTADDLKECPYIYRGWLWRNHQLIYGVDENSVYSKNVYIKHYKTHNFLVLNYFKYRTEDLLVLNLSNPSSMRNLCSFLGVKFTGQKMPHLNKS